MLLNEFFGRAINIGKQDTEPSKNRDDQEDYFLMNFILEHDKLHKDYFIPLAQKIKKLQLEDKIDKEKLIKEFMPMVNKGCMEFYHREKMTGKPEKLFPKQLREALCEKLYNHYYEDILKDNYNLGI